MSYPKVEDSRADVFFSFVKKIINVILASYLFRQPPRRKRGVGLPNLSINIINNESPLTKEHLAKLQAEATVPLEVVVKTTPSSMHSFYELNSYLKDDKFCLTTVDTIFREEEFSTFIEAFKQSDKDGYMAVTDFIDDEKPLYISTDEALNITGFHDEAISGCRYISGGIYCLTPTAVKTLHGCMEKGMSRMRNFQRQLVADGLKLKAYPFTKILDVDHASDIVKAENFLTGKDE